MRKKTLAASALALVLVGATATAAGAVGATFTWDQGTSTDLQLAANWSTDVAPGTDDNLVFPVGTTAAANGTVDYVVRSLAFQSGSFALTGSTIKLNAGLTVDGTTTIANDLDLTSAQTWTVTSGSLQTTGDIDSGAGLLTLNNAVTTVFDGELNGDDVLKTGAGMLVVRGGGLVHNIEVAQGELLLRSHTPNLGVAVTGGTLSGGNIGNVGDSQNLNSVDLQNGTVSPGPDAGGHDIGTLWIDDWFVGAVAGTLNIELRGTTGDTLHAGGFVDLNGTALVVTLTDAPAVGTRYTIVEGDSIAPTRFTYGDKDLIDQQTFVSGTHQFRIEYLDESVELVYLGEAALPATGLDVGNTIVLMGVLLLIGSVVLVVAERRRRLY